MCLGLRKDFVGSANLKCVLDLARMQAGVIPVGDLLKMTKKFWARGGGRDQLLLRTRDVVVSTSECTWAGGSSAAEAALRLASCAALRLSRAEATRFCAASTAPRMSCRA